MTGRAEWLVVGGPAEPWERLGLTVVDGTVPLFGTGLRIDPDAAPGIVGWQLSGIAADVTDIDGLATESVDADQPGVRRAPVGRHRARSRRRHHRRPRPHVRSDRGGHRRHRCGGFAKSARSARASIASGAGG